MEILNSGSFINLENQEKIEQLIFTAKEIANAAVETDGFINNEENNKRLALEIWQGAEYMCRDHEEASIKNIFINNFLERLREIGSTTKISENLPEQIRSVSETALGVENNDLKDEFLGILETDKPQEPENSIHSFSSNEIDEEPSIDEGFQSEESDLTVQNDDYSMEIAETDEFLAVETIENDGVENQKSFEPKPQDEMVQVETIQTEIVENLNNQNAAVSSIVLPEKEPYQFDKCTVTATIQLLPTETEIRRVVLSVRTHDFAPQISVVELAGEATPENLLPALETAFERYKTDLPVKVMDKLKKEKSSVKKQSNKTVAETKVSGVSQTTQATNKTVQSTEVKTAEKTTPKVTIPQPQDTLQGNLFS